MQPWDSEQQERFRVIGETGMFQAANMLSRLLGGQVSLQACRVRLLQERPLVGPGCAGEEGLGVSLKVTGDLSGVMILYLSRGCARKLVAHLLNQSGPEDLHQEPACSTLKEIGNIMVSSFLGSLEKALNIRAIPSPPELEYGSWPQNLVENRTEKMINMLVVESQFNGLLPDQSSLEGLMVLRPEPRSIELLNRLQRGKR